MLRDAAAKLAALGPSGKVGPVSGKVVDLER